MKTLNDSLNESTHHIDYEKHVLSDNERCLLCSIIKSIIDGSINQ